MRNQSLPLASALTAVLLAAILSCAPGPGGSSRQGSPAAERSMAAESRERKAVLEAVRKAYGLETQLWHRRGDIRTKEDLVAWFRAGFCEGEARRLADYLWQEGQDPARPPGPPLRVGEPVLLPADAMSVESLEAGRAVARLEYEAHSSGPTAWPAQTIRLVLSKEPDGWKICGFRPEEPQGKL